MQLTKQTARELLKGDFIPDGKPVDIRGLKFRRTRDDEVLQCCMPTGYDPQSGPFYCGDIAELVAFVEEDGQVVGSVALCNRRHNLPKGVIVSRET